MGSILEAKEVAVDEIKEVKKPLAEADLEPPCLLTEQMGPKGWVRHYYCFELPDNYDMEYVTKLLKTGYTAFKARTPIAGCEMVPTEGKQAGMFRFRQYGDEIKDFTVKDLRNGFCTFAEFKARDYPVSLLTPEKTTERGLGGEWPIRPGDRLATTFLHAIFIKGGLLMNFLTFHSQSDATTTYEFSRIMAEEIRKAQGLNIKDPVDIVALTQDREKLLHIGKGHEGKAEDHPEYIILPFTPTGLPPKLTQPCHHGHIFFFSSASLAALKEAASPSHAKLFKDDKDLPEYVTTNDALNALVWYCTLAAQHPEGTPLEGPPSMLALALDARRRVDIPIHKHTLGNILGWAPVFYDLKTILAEASLADLAILVRRSVAKADQNYYGDLNALFEKQADLTRLVPAVFLDVPGRNVFTSNWREFPFYDIEWGPALGGHMKALRLPSVGVTHCMQIALPDRPDKKGVEMFVGTEHSAMERLLKDPIWKKYAEFPADL